MRKIVVLLFLCGLSLVSSVGFGQVSPPAFSGETGTGNQILERIGVPTFHVSWACLGSIQARATASGSLAQSFAQKSFPPFLYTLDRNTVGSGEGKLEFDARGLWLGATLPVRLTNSLTLRTRGEYFVPFRDKIWASASGSNTLSTTEALYVFGVPFFVINGSSTSPGNLELDASVRTRWFFVDAEMAYSTSTAREGTSILAGVRYDRLVSTIGPGASSQVAPPGGVSGVSIPVSSSVTAELNSVCPYLGIRTSVGGPSGALTFEVKGLPTLVFTNASYKGQNGYFGEFKGEYNSYLASNLSMSVFLRGEVIHATFTELTDFTRLFSVEGLPGPSGPPFLSLTSQSSSAEVATSIHWSQLSVGGSVNLNF